MKMENLYKAYASAVTLEKVNVVDDLIDGVLDACEPAKSDWEQNVRVAALCSGFFETILSYYESAAVARKAYPTKENVQKACGRIEVIIESEAFRFLSKMYTYTNKARLVNTVFRATFNEHSDVPDEVIHNAERDYKIIQMEEYYNSLDQEFDRMHSNQDEDGQ